MPVPGAEAKPLSFNEQIRASSAMGELTHDVIKAEPSPPFFLAFFPRHGNWEAMSEGLERPTWLPVLQRIPIEPGTLVFHQRRNQTDPLEGVVSDSLALLAKRGAVVIPPGIRVAAENCYRESDPEAGFGYVRELKVQHPRNLQPGVKHIDAWETPRPALAGKRLKFDRDRGAYNRWLYALVEEGYIQPPIEGELEPKRLHMANMVEHHGTKQGLTEEHRERLVEAAEDRKATVDVAAVPEAVKMVRESARPSVKELRAKLNAGEFDDRLEELLYVETRASGLAAIKARIKALRPRELAPAPKAAPPTKSETPAEPASDG